MKITKGRIALGVMALLVLFGLAAWLAPKADATPMRKPLADALERTLGRKVEVGELHYQILPSPGLTVVDLVIPDDPAFGIEPLAYVGEMQVSLEWLPLVTGSMQVSSVRLVQASVNLARREEQGWNFSRLLEKMAAGVRARGTSPKVEMRECRINFRAGVVKSPFFLNAVDLDLDPPSLAGGMLEWRYEASPARTDRSEQGFGRFSGSGRWRPSAGPAGRLEVEMELERSAMGEILTLIAGRDLGVQGRFSSRVRIDGSLNHLAISGTAELEDVERPTFFGLRGNASALAFEGVLDLTGQSLDLSTSKEKNKPAPPLSVRVGCTRILSDPHWDVAFTFDQIPAAAMLDLARRLGVHAPPELSVEGSVVGSIGYSQNKPLDGKVELHDARVTLGGAGPLSLPSAQVMFAGSKAELADAEVTTPSASAATVGGSWDMDTGALEFHAASQALPLSELDSALASLPGVELPPLLAACKDGTFAGTLGYDAGAALPMWSAAITLKETSCTAEGIPNIELATAGIVLKNEQWTARNASGRIGPWKFSGSAARQASAARPIRFSATIDEMSGAEFDEFLQPALARRRSFLDRTLRRRPTLPPALRNRHIEGDLRIRSFKAGDVQLDDLRAKVYWDAAVIDFPSLSAKWNDAALSGRLAVRVGVEEPEYQFQGRLVNFPWDEAYFDVEGNLAANSLAGPFLPGLRGSGQFFARGLKIDDDVFRTVNGCFEYDGTPRTLRITCLDATTGPEQFTGTGTVGDGRVAIELTGARRSLRVGGRMFPLQLDFTPSSTERSR